MADAAKLLKRLGEMKSRRSVVEDAWRSAYRYTYPLRGSALETMGTTTPGDSNASVALDRQADLLDSTGTDAARILASGLMAGLTPANTRWPGLEVDGQTDEETRWLDAAAEAVWLNIHASNYDAVAYDSMTDVVVSGMCALYVDENADEGGYEFEEWPLASTYFASSKASGTVDQVFNCHTITAEQAVSQYGEDALSDKVREMATEKPDAPVEFLRAVYPRTESKPGRFARNLPFASCHVEVQSKTIVRESGYHELPVIVPRWATIPGSVYAFGPANDALPDLRTLNRGVQNILANMDLATAGMWIAQDDGVLNPKSIKIGPRKVIVAASVDSMKALTPAAKFDVAQFEIERLQRSIRKVLMADQLEPQMKAGTPPTATEIMVRVELLRQLLGPVYGRMQSEYLAALVKRCFGLALRAGALGNPPRSLMPKLIRAQYFSPLARAQKAVDVTAMDRYEAALGAHAQAGLTDALDVYDWDAARRKRAELLGVPSSLIPAQEDIDARRDERSKAQQKQALAERTLSVVRGKDGEISGFTPGAVAA